MLPRRFALCFAVLIPALVVGCANNTKSSGPTAPSTPPAAASIDLNTITPAGTPGAGTTAPLVGTVSDVTGACPDVTFTLAGVTVHVTAVTRFEGGTCADIQAGVRAGAIGTKNEKGVIEATRIKVSSPSAPGPPKTPLPHAEGTVSGLTGTCPALTFTLGNTTVRTTDKTAFAGGTCADVREGRRAGAAGPMDPGGVITADHVKIAPAPMPGASGIVSSTTGDCPALTFVVSSGSSTGTTLTTTVRTSSATRFAGGACTDVRTGAHVGASGPKAADGSIDAQVVKIAPPR